MRAILEIRGLTVDFGPAQHPLRVLHGVDLSIAPGERVGLLGESGSGKSLTALAAIGLLPRGARATAGAVRVDGAAVDTLTRAELTRLRGGRIALIFQDPMTALAPLRRVSAQFADVLAMHRGLRGAAARQASIALLEAMQVPDPPRVMEAYPSQLSGGMRQRVLIALALVCEPALIIADEITTAIDAAARHEVIALLQRAVSQRGAAVLLISHDVGVLRQACETLVVMYRGVVVERGPTEAVLSSPAHPYTRMLLRSLPGSVPPRTPLAVGSTLREKARSGCVFRSRCAAAIDACDRAPSLEPCGAAHAVACWVRGEQA